MEDDRLDSLEEADRAFEEIRNDDEPDKEQKMKLDYSRLQEVEQLDRRSGGDRRSGRQGHWQGPERRSGNNRRMEERIFKDKIVPRKGKGILALVLFAFVLGVTLYLTPFMLWQPVEEITWVNQEPVDLDYDVIVVGAEPEGIAAAVSAARNGMKTLLLEKSASLGGLMTLGQLNFLDMCYDWDNTLLTRGIFEEFYAAVDGTAFDITVAKNYFIDLVTLEDLLTLRTESALIAPLMEGERVAGVRMLEKGGEMAYTAKRVIDATADGDLAAMTGAPYTYGGEDIGEKDRQMGVTLVFELSGVSWPKVFFHLNLERAKGLLSGGAKNIGATNKSAWGYEEEGFSYIPHDQLMRLRGFNIARQRNGTVLINALLIFGVDPLTRNSYNAAAERVKAELYYLIPYIRQNFTGFEKAELAATASRLYVRETRHFIGEYQLGIDDVLGNRDQWDKIAIGGYPADVQPSLEQPFGTVIGNPDRYAIPFRCLIPLNADNLLIVGRSASYTSLAASSARVLPLGMVVGQAAGAAAAQSVREDMDFRRMSRDPSAIHRLQSTLKGQGAYLEDFIRSDPNASHWAYEGLAALRRLGLMDGGYQNDYRLEEPMDKWRFQYMLNGVIRKAGYSLNYFEVEEPPACGQVLDAVASALLAAEELKAWSAVTVSRASGRLFLPAAPDGTTETGADAAGTPDPEDRSAGTPPGAGLPGTPGQPAQAASGRSFAENREILEDAGLLNPLLTPYFVDSKKVPEGAETAMLLRNLYLRISLAD